MRFKTLALLMLIASGASGQTLDQIKATVDKASTDLGTYIKNNQPIPTPTPVPVSWIDCAMEGGTCSFQGTTTVRYGFGDKWASKEATESIGCTNGVFGDPAVGVGKVCQVKTGTVLTSAPPPPVLTGPAEGVSMPPTFKQRTVAGDVSGFNLQNPSATPIPEGYVTFAQAFVAGDVPSTNGLQAVFNGTAFGVQMDIKTKHADGSAKFAILSMKHPSIPANSSLSAMLRKQAPITATPVSLADVTKAPTVTIAFTEPEVNTVVINLNEKIKASTDFWLKGSRATQARFEMPVTRAMRFIADVTKYADGSLKTDINLANDVAMGPTGGKLKYTVTYNNNGKITQYKDIVHYQYAQLRRSFQSVATPKVNVQRDMAYQIKTRVILPYALTLGVYNQRLAEMGQSLIDPLAMTPFESFGITKYMGMTGGRADIGSLREETAHCLISQDVRACDFMMLQAQSAAGIPWHYYDQAKKRWISLDDYPSIWFDGRGNEPPLTQHAEGNYWTKDESGKDIEIVQNYGWQPDTAHKPNQSAAPYLLTGSRQYYDAVMAEATFVIGSHWQYPRQNGLGLVNNGNQVRGSAWSMRDISYAADFAVDGSYEKTYFSKIRDNNWKFVVDSIPDWKAALGEVHGQLYSGGYPGNAWAPWQIGYFASAVAHDALRGHVNAKKFMTDYLRNWYVVCPTVKAEGFNNRDCFNYNLPTTDAVGTITTWKRLGAAVGTGTFGTSGPWNAGGNYVQHGLAAISLYYEVTKDPLAKTAYDWVWPQQDGSGITENHFRAVGNLFYTVPK